MAWKADIAEERIRGLIASVPRAEIVVEDFQDYVADRRREMAKAYLPFSEGDALLRIPRNRAITTHGVHIYANLIDFNGHLIDAGRETEASHERALQFLHAHYSACDQLIASFGLQRVDFHGPRLHAVVLTPPGPGQELARILKAIAFAAAFREMVARTGARYGTRFQTGVRVGIDSGPAIAMDGGKRDEPEPLFIGSPANHAAKLADGAEEGIFSSQRVQRLLAGRTAATLGGALSKSFEDSLLNESMSLGTFSARGADRLEDAFAAFSEDMEVRKSIVSEATFQFHYRQPPLRTLQFADHPPSRTVRMPLASLLADLDGFTAYVDEAMLTGKIAEAVANLHVIRGEMAAVVRADFDGRKVRFIGDSIHGLLAEGDARQTDTHKTIEKAVLAAGGVRSSFELCRDLLPGVLGLGIAIGIDYGPTPICRIGLRGDSSVRCATSRATCVSEAEQQGCDGRETALGEAAYAAASISVRQAFGPARKIPNLTYANAAMLLGTMASPYVSRVEPQPLRAHAPVPLRAHDRP